MYPYLTGSASWYLLTLVEEVFGIKGHLGKVLLDPKLVKEDFKNSTASVTTLVNHKRITFSYHNFHNLDYGEYQIANVYSNKKETYTLNYTEKGSLIIEEIIDAHIHIKLSPIKK